LVRLAPTALCSLIPLALAAANGGYFPTSWGWSAVGLAWFAGVAASAHRSVLARRDALLLAFLGALAGWIWLSWRWSIDPGQTWLEGLRVLVLPLGAAALLLSARRVGSRMVAASLVAATTGISGYSLATRLLPDHLGHFNDYVAARLSAPVGYWNALGLFAVFGVVLALGFLARGRSPATGAIVAAALPVLVTTIYFTFSRGSWIALAIGLVVAVAFDPHRLPLVAATAVVAAPVAAAVYLASRLHGLTFRNTSLAQAAHDGHHFAPTLLLLVLAAAACGAVYRLAAPRVRLGGRVTRAFDVALAVVAVVAVAGGLVAAGGPVRLADRVQHAFSAPPPKVTGDLNQRLFNFSGNGRVTLWKSAWAEYKAHPLLGAGAGSYEQYWLQHRPEGMKVRDAHSLYLETLAELGPIGLALLLVALAIPLTALRRARRQPLVPALAGAYVAYLAHAAVDWDWEILAVTLTALFCGAGILIAARTGDEKPLTPRVRYGIVGLVLAVMAVAFVGLVGNIELSRAATAAGNGNWAASARDAKRAETWAPWSSQPWQALGEAQLGAGDLAAARASFRTAIRKSPKDWNLWFDLARASLGRAQARALAQAARLNPLSPEIAEFRREIAGDGTITVEK
jgi:hypothetical protein